LIEQQVLGAQKKLCGNKKQRQLRRRRIAQLSQGIHGRVVKKLEKGKTAASVKLNKKNVPKDEEINMSLEKGKGGALSATSQDTSLRRVHTPTRVKG
jgi:hypothetical protein